jgi:hypothetical protein
MNKYHCDKRYHTGYEKHKTNKNNFYRNISITRGKQKKRCLVCFLDKLEFPDQLQILLLCSQLRF